MTKKKVVTYIFFLLLFFFQSCARSPESDFKVFRLIDQKQNRTYAEAVRLMARVKRLANITGTPDRFARLLDRVRTEHKAKRNLMEELGRRRW